MCYCQLACAEVFIRLVVMSVRSTLLVISVYSISDQSNVHDYFLTFLKLPIIKFI